MGLSKSQYEQLSRLPGFHERPTLVATGSRYVRSVLALNEHGCVIEKFASLKAACKDGGDPVRVKKAIVKSWMYRERFWVFEDEFDFETWVPGAVKKHENEKVAVVGRDAAGNIVHQFESLSKTVQVMMNKTKTEGVTQLIKIPGFIGGKSKLRKAIRDHRTWHGLYWAREAVYDESWTPRPAPADTGMPVVRLDTGEVFSSMQAASRALGFASEKNVAQSIKDVNKCGGTYWAVVTDRDVQEKRIADKKAAKIARYRAAVAAAKARGAYVQQTEAERAAIEAVRRAKAEAAWNDQQTFVDRVIVGSRGHAPTPVVCCDTGVRFPSMSSLVQWLILQHDLTCKANSMKSNIKKTIRRGGTLYGFRFQYEGKPVQRLVYRNRRKDKPDPDCLNTNTAGLNTNLNLEQQQQAMKARWAERRRPYDRSQCSSTKGVANDAFAQVATA